MDWAGRHEDAHPALVDFENLDGWTVDCTDAAASLVRSRQQQLWGQYVGKLVYHGTGPQPAVRIRPPRPVPIAGPWDCLNFWVYGNNWAWVPDPQTPPVEIAVVLRGKGGQTVRVVMGRVYWEEWWLMHQRLPPAQQALVQEGAALEAIEVTGGRNQADRTLFFDNLSCYQEKLPSLEFAPRPRRGITPFEGQRAGTNTGPGRLPFPTREETILPDNLARPYTTDLEERSGVYQFHYRGGDGHLVYRYAPNAGTWSDLTARWEGRGRPFRPLAGGGIDMLASDGGPAAAPEKIELAGCRREGDTVQSTWRCRRGGRTAEVTYTLRLWQKSLVLDVKCLGSEVADVHVGRAVGVDNPRLVTLPYLTGEAQRPAVLVSGPPKAPLFTFALFDHCRSNASRLWAVNGMGEDGVAYNGGVRYLPKTDGRRNDCFERLFLTVSPRLEEVLPNIPNPQSPWMHVAGERLWRAHGADKRDQDYALWKQVARYGMTKVVITDHETGWRDGGESFTFRTRAAPGKGGDPGQAEYSRKIHELGFRYGIYNNYTDFAPVNGNWHEDHVTRLSDGQWQAAWARCYNPKPAWAVEMEARLAPVIQEKFHLDTAYCDVHTAVTPWNYCDFDARVPGAGTLAATFYAYGEIMLHQKKTWGGPVYSEGNNHWYYCGLTDGNYGQDQMARLAEHPWLVDFDLRKLHPLCCNFGMGSPDMFYVDHAGARYHPENPDAWLDHFLAATLAFGHTGFLVMEGGMRNAVRSYFNLQQVHARYARETAVDIRYADAGGKLLDTSAAVATGAYRRSQVVTRYSNGLVVAVNGHPQDTWKIGGRELPPDGWYVKGVGSGQSAVDSDRPAADFSAESVLVDGHRADYVDSPAYTYCDGRGRFTRFPKAAADGTMIAHRRPDGRVEVIPVDGCTVFGVALDGRQATAQALDADNRPLGPAATRISRGLVYVVPRDKAFSYLLTPGMAPAAALRSPQEKAVPGQTVSIEAGTPPASSSAVRKFRIPADAPLGKVLWHQVDQQWIDFLVVPLADSRLVLDKTLTLELVPHVPQECPGEITLGDRSWTVRLSPGTPVRLEIPVPPGRREEVREIPLRIVAGELSYARSWWLKRELAQVNVAPFPQEFSKGQCLRRRREEPLTDKNSAQVVLSSYTCGGVQKRCLFMHPPYTGGTGYAFAVYGPIELPDEPAGVFRCLVGKADGSDPGDGILFRVAVLEPGGRRTLVAQKQWIQHAWTPLSADLAPWAGRRIRLEFISDVGPADDSSGDWACWAEMRIESDGFAPETTLHESRPELARQRGPQMLAGLSRDQIRRARRGTLHFEAVGLDAQAPYISYAQLNQVPLGPLPGTGGDEVHGKWAPGALPLPAAALARLVEWNELAISNPGHDSFAIGRFWLELELADGRRGSSQITARRFKQPAEWPYGAGEAVPFDQQIQTTIHIPLE
jgi:hypothetical protein